jgi:hypothetical protein
VPLPDFGADGYLPPGIHAASFAEVQARFGVGSEARERQIGLLQQVVEAAKSYPTIKRILVWGSFVTAKREPNDLDYSVIVSVTHDLVQIAPEHRRFLAPLEARQFYGVDKNYLIIQDYPLEDYIDHVDFLCRTRRRQPRGIIEISVRGEFSSEETA